MKKFNAEKIIFDKITGFELSHFLYQLLVLVVIPEQRVSNKQFLYLFFSVFVLTAEIENKTVSRC